MRAALLIFAIAMASTIAAADPKNLELGETVAEALGKYRSNDVHQRSVEELVMIGMLYELSWANSALKAARHEQPLFCQPPLSLTVDQVMTILAASVRDKPDVASEPLGYALIFELEKVFPCTEKEHRR